MTFFFIWLCLWQVYILVQWYLNLKWHHSLVHWQKILTEYSHALSDESGIEPDEK
jgi:hypothetical protein